MAATNPPKDEDYVKWKASIFGSDYMIWHEGLDTDAANSFVREAREEALRMLLYGVSTGDGNAATILAVMGETSALGEIRAAMDKYGGANKVSFAQAVRDLSPKDRRAEVALSKKLVEVLESPYECFGPRVRAAIALKEVGDAQSERALLKAIEHDEGYLVRYHASEALLARWGVKPASISSHMEIFSLICAEEGDTGDVLSRRREGVSRLKELRKGGGKI